MDIKDIILKHLNESNSKKSLELFTKNFNKKIRKEELDSLKSDTHNDLRMINESIAFRYLSSLAYDFLGAIPSEVELRNTSKKPENHFQLEAHLSNGNILYALFLYVDNNHEVILNRSNIELLNNDYETIEVLNDTR